MMAVGRDASAARPDDVSREDDIDARDLVDGGLELLVLPSFSRIGFDLRRRMYRWPDIGRTSLRRRTVLVIGPTSGLGRAAVSHFAAMGARVLLVGRDAARLERTKLELTAWSGNHEIAAYPVELSSLASVRAAGDAIGSAEHRLDVLVDNAGGIVPDRRTSADGYELTFATSVLGPFALTGRLLPLLRDSAQPGSPSRIVAVASGGMYAQRLHLEDLQSSVGEYHGPAVFARAKRAQVVLIRELARRLRDQGVVANAMHPGWADTPGLASSLPAFREFLGPYARTAEEGVDTVIWLAAAPEAAHVSGRLFLDRRSRPFDRIPGTRVGPMERQALWDLVAGMSGAAPEAG